jgi:NACHT domain
MEDIHHPDTRRPHLLVGGVGAGKTAVLVQLTSLFAKHRAVPVPIRLRDATDGLNFREMAHSRFLAMAESSMLAADDAEKVWRQLSKDDKIVVIADGLEEALTEGSASIHQDRDNLIRLAIHRAHELRLPLIIASRPHDPLRGADATIMELEPLSEEAALEYIDPSQNSSDARWLDWLAL